MWQWEKEHRSLPSPVLKRNFIFLQRIRKPRGCLGEHRPRVSTVQEHYRARTLPRKSGPTQAVSERRIRPLRQGYGPERTRGTPGARALCLQTNPLLQVAQLCTKMPISRKACMVTPSGKPLPRQPNPRKKKNPHRKQPPKKTTVASS